MKQGMDRGNKGTDRRTGTSRISKPADSSTKRAQAQPGKPATGRMNVQGGGSDTARREQQEQQRAQGQPQAQDSSKTTLYVGIGGGALVFALILTFMMSNSESNGQSGGGTAGAETIITQTMNKATKAFQRGEYHTDLDIYK